MASLMLVFIVTAGMGTYLTVHFLIRGQNTVVVPDLIGKEIVYALEVLTDLGLNTKVKQVTFDPNIPKHYIIAQDPEPGYEIKTGRDVRLVISRGPRTVIIPNLSGLALAQADIIIEENGLARGQLSRVYHSLIPREEIVAQFPLPGLTGVRGDTVDLLVSAGRRPQTMQMMDLTKMDLNHAIALIERNGLKVGTVAMEARPAAFDDMVIAHRPKAGYPVRQGNLVNLTINRPEPKASATQSRPGALFRYHTPSGFLRQHVRIAVSQETMTLDIFDDFVKPGKTIWLSIPRHTATALFLYVDGDLIRADHY